MTLQRGESMRKTPLESRAFLEKLQQLALEYKARGEDPNRAEVPCGVVIVFLYETKHGSRTDASYAVTCPVSKDLPIHWLHGAIEAADTYLHDRVKDQESKTAGAYVA